MKTLIRILTATFLFIFLFIVLSIGALAIGGAVAGMLHSSEVQAKGFDEGFAAGQQAGAKFGAAYGRSILIGSFIVSLAIASTLSFSNVLPWCRSKREALPPPLP